ncbi:MAG: GNAT family N-acetyltransferase [Bacteroidales bacterium]
MIELKTLNKHQLSLFIQSDTYATMSILPISKHRAISHIHNPRANDDDVLLILAYENNQLVGYLGVLPDDVYTVTGEIFHVGWLSCIWVNPIARGKGIAKKMVLKAYEAYNHQILITNFTREAGLLYQKLDVFENLPDMVGYRYYRKMCLADILPNRFPKVKSLFYLFKLFDATFNLFWSPFLNRKINKIRLENALPSNDYLKQSNVFNVLTGFKRSEKEFRWIESYPWIKQVKTKSNEANKYHFSSEEKQFESTFLQICEKDEVLGYIKYIYRNGHLRVPYIIYSQVNTEIIAKAITQLILQKDASYVTLFLPNDVKLKLNFRYIYKKPIIRHFKITKELNHKINSITIFDGDGDASFT